MRQKISYRIHSWFPSLAKEDISFEHDTFLEWFFYAIVDRVRRIAHREKIRSSETFLDKIINLGIIFILLFILSSIFLAIPVILSDNNPVKIKFIFQMGIILLFGSIAWSSYIFICQEFKNLIRLKVLSVLDRQGGDGFKNFLCSIFNGINIVWPNKYQFRIFRRDISLGLFIISVGFYLYILESNQGIFQNLSPILIEFIIQILIVFFPICLLLFMTFVIFSIILTIILYMIFLLSFVWLVPMEIQPYLDMGGTAPYGTIIIHGLYTSGLAISLLPLLVLVNQIDFNLLLKGYAILQDLENQSVENIASTMRNFVNSSYHDITIGSFTKYSQWIFLFILIVLLGLMVIFIIHHRIQQRKIEEISRLENMLSSTDLNNPENFVNRDRS